MLCKPTHGKEKRSGVKWRGERREEMNVFDDVDGREKDGNVILRYSTT